MRTSALLIWLLLFHTGCWSPERSQSPSVVSYDSSGVAVVVNAAPEHDVIDLTLASPVSSFGMGQGEEIGSLARAVRQESGAIVFIDSQSREVRRLVPGGGIETLARQGSGPGEVVFPAFIQRLTADSIHVYDRRLGKVIVYTPTGQLAYEIPLLRAGATLPLSVMRAQDTLLVGPVLGFANRQTLTRSAHGNLAATPIAMVLYDIRGSILDTVTTLRPGPLDIEHEGASLMTVYGYGLAIAVNSAGMLLHGAGDQASFDVRGLDGRLRRIHRFERRRQPVDVDSLKAILLNDRPSGPAPGWLFSDAPMLEPEFLPDSQPAFKDLRAYSTQVWVGSAEPFLMPSRVWEVFAEEGRWLGTVVLPGDAQLLDVASGYIVLRRSDPMGVHYVEVYAAGDSFAGSTRDSVVSAESN